MVLDVPEIAARSIAGQFIMVRQAENTVDPYLRRPFSIMDISTDGKLDFVFKIIGRGTALLAEKKAGEKLDLLGPLGNGFLPDRKPHRAIIVGGGIGIPPLYLLTKTLLNLKTQDITVILGGRTSRDIPLTDMFNKLGVTVVITTNDGSQGLSGVVTDPLKPLLEETVQLETVVYGCGPDPMLQAVTELARTHEIEAKVSMEEHMACGIGACLGCVVDTDTGKQRVCKEGPVFDGNHVKKWETA